MTGQFFISLLNPGVGLLLALAFWVLWLHQRDQSYIAFAAIGYLVNALGFTVQDVLPPLPHELHRIPSNLLFLLSACFIVGAVLMRYGIKPPILPMGALVVSGMAGLFWFLVIDHNIAARILIASTALGGISSLIAIHLWGRDRHNLIDKVLFWLSVATALNFVLRPIFILWLSGGDVSYDGFQQSLYWSTVQFTQALISVSFALLLMVAVASDLINELRRQAVFDELSGLLNRRGFGERAAATLGLGSERRQTAGLLIADFDHFKSLNDSFGHAAGDAAIKAFGDLVRQSMPADAIAGRIGGEEFAVLVPNADSRSLRNYAEIIRTGIKSVGASRLPEGANLSVSVGMALGLPGIVLHDLMSKADTALYQAKRSGRNRVSAEQPEPVSNITAFPTR